MNISFNLRGRKAGAPPIPGKEARIPGTKDMLVGRDGHLSAYDQKDLFRTISHLMAAAADGSIDTADAQPAQAKANAARQRREMLTAAFADKKSGQWAELGSTIAGQITESADREGFMRRMLAKNDLQLGNVPRIRVRRKNVTAVVMSTPSMLQPQYARENYLFPPEFTVSANIRVEQREMNQGSGDLLEEKFYEAQEQVMVQEDRMWKKLADAVVGIDHQLKYLVGGLNPTSLTEMRTELSRFNIAPLNCLMAADFWNDITGNTQFSAWFDPVTKYEIVTTGELGQMLGLTFITDGFRQEQLKVLESGEMYIVGDPMMHGGYTDRGPVQSQEVNNYSDGVAARGWFMYEDLSMVIANARSLIKGKRT
jgi:hypothetical protein